MLTLRQLRYFEALSRHLHFGRAAEECAITQPALSMQIREMEETHGVVLLERGRQGVRLTAIGEVTAQRARAVLSSIQDLERTLRDHTRLLEGQLRLGVIPTIAPYLLPRLLPALEKHHPGLEVALRESITGQLVSALAEGELDVVIMSLPAEHPELDHEVLFQDPFFLALPPGADSQLAVPVAVDDLHTADLLLLEDGHCLRDQALQLCHQVDERQLRRFGASSLATLVEMVASGQGSTLLPALFLEAEPNVVNRLRLLPFQDPAPSRDIGLVWRRTLPFAEDVAELAHLVRACAPVLHLPEAATDRK